MKKFIITFLFLFLFSFLFAQQQGKITYTLTFGNGQVTRIMDMWFTDDNYLYEYRYDDPAKTPLFNQLKSKKPDFDSAKFVNETMKEQRSFPHPNFYGTTQNNIQIQRLLLQNKPVCVIDTLRRIAWTLLPDTLTIKGIFCQKATCNFNDFGYDAWYAPSIPVSAAPQSFQGLPGLLIKLDNLTTHNTIISMLELEWPTPNPVKIEPCSGYTTMSRTKFLQKEKEANEKLDKLISDVKQGKIKNINEVMDILNN